MQKKGDFAFFESETHDSLSRRRVCYETYFLHKKDKKTTAKDFDDICPRNFIMRSLVTLVVIVSMVSIEAYRLPGLGHFRKENEYPTFEAANFLSYIRDLIAPQVNSKNETEIDGRYEFLTITISVLNILFSVFSGKANETENVDDPTQMISESDPIGVRIM